MGFRYDFSFAQVGLSTRMSTSATTLVQSASGSLITDAKTNYIGATNRVSVGKGGITLYPFLDLNCNGKREPDEPKANGLNVHINGGRIELSEKDSNHPGVRSGTLYKYLITLDGTNFDNIAWQIRKKTIRVSINPNMFRLIEVPIAIVGEVSGTVYYNVGKDKEGQGRIIVNFYRNDSILVAHTLTESDGYFSYLGLAPGDYTARVDTVQLSKLHWKSTPFSLPFTISKGIDGDVADGLEFVLRPEQNKTPEPIMRPGERRNKIATNKSGYSGKSEGS